MEEEYNMENFKRDYKRNSLSKRISDQPTESTEQKQDNLENIYSILKSQYNLQKQQYELLNRLLDNKEELYYDIENVITTSVPTQPEDPNSSIYQKEKIKDVLGRNSKKLTIANDGPGILYVTISSDGTGYRDEITILEGHQKVYTDINSVNLRSPTAKLKYRVTERDILPGIGRRVEDRYENRRDGSGVEVFRDNYESPTFKFKKLTVGGLGTINRSLDTAYSRNFSLKCDTSTNVNGLSMCYFHPDFHDQKVGAQINFAKTDPAYDIHLSLLFYDGTGNTYQGEIFVDAGQFEYVDTNGSNVVLLNVQNDPTYDDIHSWNILKIVADLSTKKYVSGELNGKKFDLSGSDLRMI